jgi:hypothetical protein
MYHSNLKGANVFEVKTYRYTVAAKTMATIEVLLFENGQIGSQGTLEPSGEGFSPAEIYETENEAVQGTIEYLENIIKDDEWVIKTAENELIK